MHQGKRLEYELLEEITLALQHRLQNSPLPYCAFNGGVGGVRSCTTSMYVSAYCYIQVWIDIGDKKHGIECLQSYLKVTPGEV